MTAGRGLPDGFVVHLRDDVTVDRGHLITDQRVVRLADVASDLLQTRVLTVSSQTTATLAGRLLDLDMAVPVLEGFSAPGLDCLTVVIPVHGAAAGVERLVARLGGRVRCIVVDDASPLPGPIEKVVHDRGAQLVRLDVNVGPAAARDAGLRHVTTPFVAFVDADVEASPQALARLLTHMQDPGLAAVAPRVRSVSGGGWIERYEQTDGSLDMGPTAATVRPWSRVAYVPSACLVARVAALGSGFDPQMRSGEDVDLIWRLQTDGHRVRYDADVVVHHETRSSLGAWLGRKAFYGTSAAMLARRHDERMAPAVLTPHTAAGVALVLLQRRWSVVLGAALLARAGVIVWSSTPEIESSRRRRIVRSHLRSVVGQTSDLLLRHWSPATAVLCLISSRARRATLTFAVADAVFAHRSVRSDLDLARYGVLRRSEQLAYGTGVWWGATRERSARCLVPLWVPPVAKRARS